MDVRVLPDVHGEDGSLALGDGVAGANGLVNNKLAAVPRQPRPARAESGVASTASANPTGG